MRKLLTTIGCIALLAIVIVPMDSMAQQRGGGANLPGPGVSVGSYSEDPGMGLDKGKSWAEVMRELQYLPLEDDAFKTVSGSRAYRITKLDNKASSKAIAWEQVKQSIVNELVDLITAEAKASRNVSKKVYGKAAGLSYELLPPREAIRVILPGIISFEQTGEKRTKGSLRLKAKTRFALARIVPAAAYVYGEKAVYSKISSIRELATAAMDEIMQMQEEMAESGNKDALSHRYSDAVGQLVAADRLEGARYLASQDQTQEAIDACTVAIENSPGLAIAYRHRGALYASLKDNSRALADYLKAYSNDAIDHMESSEFGRCVEDTEAAMRLHPDYAVAYYQRAVCRVGLGQQKRARRDFVRAAQLGDERAQDLLTSKDIAW